MLCVVWSVALFAFVCCLSLVVSQCVLTMPFVVRGSLQVVVVRCSVLVVVCWLVFVVVCRALFGVVVRCVLLVVCCMLLVVCGLLFVAVRGVSFVVGC